jgi:hypothetical protein
MADLPAHVKFPPNGDGWVVIDGTDVITSVQAFVDGPELVIELWGKTTVISPNNERYANHKFQDNSWTNLSDYSWRARRIVHDVTEMGHSADEAIQIQFSAEGSKKDILRFRKV